MDAARPVSQSFVLGKEQWLGVGVLCEDEFIGTMRMELGRGVVGVHGSRRCANKGGGSVAGLGKGVRGEAHDDDGVEARWSPVSWRWCSTAHGCGFGGLWLGEVDKPVRWSQ